MLCPQIFIKISLPVDKNFGFGLANKFMYRMLIKINFPFIHLTPRNVSYAFKSCTLDISMCIHKEYDFIII